MYSSTFFEKKKKGGHTALIISNPFQNNLKLDKMLY